MQRRIWALLLCGVLLLGVLAGCGKKNDTGDTSGDKTVNGTETKNDADSQLTAKYVYQAQYLELPVKTSYIDDSAVSGDTLFFYAQVQDESYAAANSDTPAEGPVYYPTVGKLLTYDLDTQTVGETDYTCDKCIVSVGRVGSKWMEGVCQELKIPTKSNRVDIGVRVEIPAVVFSHLTDELYESKIVYRTEKFEDNVRTFCMNPNGIVVNENTNGIVTVNGHSYEDKSLQTENTNFALLVAKHFSEPFKDSNGYGESIARLSNMLGGGVIVQRFGDLVRGRRSTVKRIEEGLVTPTLAATPGDLSLVLPKRILDGIIEMIYALDKIAPGTANDDTLLYGVEVKFYNMEVALDEHLETPYKGLYVIGDGSGITHSLSHASASGVYVAREILETV